MELVKSHTTSIKGIAILLMLWHHLFLSTVEYGVWANSFSSIAKLCVALFLFVSGYGLTKQYAKLEKPYLKNTVKFLVLRYLKFFLPYWFCFVIIVAVGNAFGYSFADAYPPSRNTLKCFLLDILGQMGYASYLPTWWFNKMILQLYFVFPLLYLLVRNRYVALVALAAIAVMQPNALRLPGNIFFVVEGGLPAFFVGMMMAKHPWLPQPVGKATRIVAGVIAIVLCLGLAVLHQSGIGVYYTILVRAAMAVSVAYLFSLASSQFAPLQYVGQFATTMYLLHTLFLKLIPNVVYAPRFPILIFLWFLAFSLAGAVLIGYLQKLVRYDNLQGFVLGKVERLFR